MNEKKARTKLFKHLDGILSVSHKKFKINNKRDESRLKWGGLMVRAVRAYGQLLETAQLDDLMKEIELIKKELKMK